MTTLIAVGDTGDIRTSTNEGTSFTTRTSGTTESLVCGASNPSGSRVAVFGTNGKIITSDDQGVTWTTRTPPHTSFTPQTACYGGGFWVCGGYNNSGQILEIWASVDGVTWTAATPLGFSGSFISNLNFAQGKFWATWGAFPTPGQQVVLSSRTGNPVLGGWDIAFTAYGNIYGIGSDGNTIIASSYAGYSAFANVTTRANLGYATQVTRDIATNGEVWVAVGYWSGQFFSYSPNADGTDWQPSAPVPAGFAITNSELSRVLWTGNNFIAMGQSNGRIYVSATGTSSWTERDTGIFVRGIINIPNSPPNSPLHFLPVPAARIDFTQSNVFQVFFRDPDIVAGDSQKSIAFKFQRTLPSGAAAKWWNVSTNNFQGTEVFNVQGSGLITIPANKIGTNGETYQWSANTKDQTDLSGTYSTPDLVTGSTAPVLDVTGPNTTITNTTRPTITWVMTDVDGDPQESYHVKLYGSFSWLAITFDINTTLALWDSGVVFSDAEEAQVGVDIGTNGFDTYRAYVFLTQLGAQPSNMDYCEFAVDIALPDTPSLLIMTQPSRGRNRLHISGGLGSYTEGTYVVEYDDGDGAWTTLPNGQIIVPDVLTAVIYDYLAPPGIERAYRVRTVAALSTALVVSSASSPVQTATLILDDWWLKLWSDPTKNVILNMLPPFSMKQGRSVEVFQPLAASMPVVFDQGIQGRDGTLSCETFGQANHDALDLLLKSSNDLLIQDPFQHQIWVHVSGDYTPELQEGGSLRYGWKIPIVEVDAPSVVIVPVVGTP